MTAQIKGFDSVSKRAGDVAIPGGIKCCVFGRTGIRLRIAAVEAQAVNDLYLRGFGKGKETVKIGFVRQFPGVTVGRVAAEAETFDAEGMKQVDERVVVAAEVMNSVRARQQQGCFEAQSLKICGDDRAGVLRVQSDGHQRFIGDSSGRQSEDEQSGGQPAPVQSG